MISNADIYIKNNFCKAITVSRERNGHQMGMTLTLNSGDYKRIPLLEPKSFLTINAPEGIDARSCYVKISSDVDIQLKYLRTKSKWTVRILTNELPPDVGPSVHIEIGEDGPE